MANNKMKERIQCVSFAFLYILPLLLSIIILVAAVWLSNSCVSFGIARGLVACGIAMLILGLLGCVAMSVRRAVGVESHLMNLLSAFYFLFTAIFSIVILGYVIYAFSVTGYSGSPDSVPDRAYVEYRLDHFSHALRRQVSGNWRWDPIISCLTPSIACAQLDNAYSSAQQLFAAHLNPLQAVTVQIGALTRDNFATLVILAKQDF
ncbi:unnamed protein product [Cuscuta epithymum]|uniref:Transmembrane protein n=1 Tax=Cuscuta epithymum TaxID=186058 RepID=A0AAV0CC47_9ASTE|nr:unnamed protein product [Cuscuta epithymum]